MSGRLSLGQPASRLAFVSSSVLFYVTFYLTQRLQERGSPHSFRIPEPEFRPFNHCFFCFFPFPTCSPGSLHPFCLSPAGSFFRARSFSRFDPFPCTVDGRWTNASRWAPSLFFFFFFFFFLCVCCVWAPSLFERRTAAHSNVSRTALSGGRFPSLPGSLPPLLGPPLTFYPTE